MDQTQWAPLADRQAGMLARRQLLHLGYNCDYVRTQLRAGRWKSHGPTVISTVTGELTSEQRRWLAVLHADHGALIGGLTAAAAHGLAHWNRDDITVLVPPHIVLRPVTAIHWVRTRRSLRMLRDPASSLPTARLEPAVLIFGAAERSARTAIGVMAAAVQQSLTTPGTLLRWIDLLAPLRRAGRLREALADMTGGAQSMGEIDVERMCRMHGLASPTRQTRRRDSAGNWRYTDCEWEIDGGRVVILEVDGGFHMEIEHWQADIARARALVSPHRIVVRCTTMELRDNSDAVAGDLHRLGVPARVLRAC
jgi:hypothetical protein